MPPQQAKCLPQIVWVRRFSHRFHRIHRNSCGGYSPTDFTDLHRLLGRVDSPTDFTEFTETLAGDILPQISRIYTDCLGAKILPQISRNSQKLLRGIFSHRFHRSTQIVWVRRFSHRLHGSTQIVWVPSRGCTCLKCTNRATLVHLLLCWCTSCSGKRQSRAETSAPPEVSSFCVNLCNLWEAFCLLRRPETSATIFRTLTICVNL